MSQDLFKAPDGLSILCARTIVLAAWPVSENRSSGLSAKARALVGKAQFAGTVRAFRSGWNKFHSWCGGRKINPVSCSVESIVIFLQINKVWYLLVHWQDIGQPFPSIMIQWSGLQLVSILWFRRSWKGLSGIILQYLNSLTPGMWMLSYLIYRNWGLTRI